MMPVTYPVPYEHAIRMDQNIVTVRVDLNKVRQDIQRLKQEVRDLERTLLILERTEYHVNPDRDSDQPQPSVLREAGGSETNIGGAGGSHQASGQVTEQGGAAEGPQGVEPSGPTGHGASELVGWECWDCKQQYLAPSPYCPRCQSRVGIRKTTIEVGDPVFLSSGEQGVVMPSRDPICHTDCGDGTTVYDDRPRVEQ